MFRPAGTELPRTHWPFLLAVLALGLAFYAGVVLFLGDRFRPIGDGKLFLVTGERLLEGEISGLYAPVEGTAPFTYLPHTSAYFAIFALAGQELGHRLYLLSNLLAAWGSLALLLFAIEDRFASRVRLYATLLVACVPFWFVTFEQFFVGNIDFTLLLALLLQYKLFEARRPLLQGLVLGALVSFKPQMLLFLVLPLLWGQLAPVVVALGTVVLGLPAFYAITGGSFAMATAHLETFSEWTRHLGLQISPVSQSLRSLVLRMFGDSPYLGRFDPEWHQPRELDYHLVSLPGGIAQILSLALPLMLGAWVLHRLVALDRRQARVTFLALLGLLPTLAPGFWQVHMVYVLPLAVALAAELSSGMARESRWFVWSAAAAVTFASNPLVLGGRGADLVQSYGAYYFAVLAWLMLLLWGCPRTRAADYRALFTRWWRVRTHQR